MYDKGLKKGRRLAIACLFFVWISPAWGQAVFFIRDVKQSIVLEEFNATINQFVLSPYGEVNSLLGQNQQLNPYSFQGQEYDKELGMYFFPARLYLSDTKRFLQPDPKSQYFSAYSYVNGDPVNYLDFNGKEGSKMLFLYNNDYDQLGGIDVGTRDLMDATPDAYHYSLGDFINGKVGDVSEFSGEVFILSHSNADSPDLEVEAGTRNRKMLKLQGRETFTRESDHTLGVRVNSEELGERLRMFSEEKGIPIKSVVVGSCESETCAKALAKGFTGNSKEVKDLFKVKGFKRGFRTKIKGPKSLKSMFLRGDIEQPGGTMFMVKDGRKDTHAVLEEDGKATYYGNYYPESNEMVPRMQGQEMQDFLRGRETAMTENMVREIGAHY